MEKNPQPGEVWQTKGGRLALIIVGHIPTRTVEKFVMLWHDLIDGWTASEIMDRLEYKTILTPAQFYDVHMEEMATLQANRINKGA